VSAGEGQAKAQQAVRRAQQAASQVRLAAATRAHRETLAREMFAVPVREQAHRGMGRPVRVLRAGCLTPLDELGLCQLRASGFEITVVTVDRDLRTVPLPPRSFDIVHCALLLDRIRHVELVLDRLTAALRPGGLLLLHIRDRDCAVGLLHRWLPLRVRRLLWGRLDPSVPGRPGPFPAVHEKCASDRGIQAHTRLRGLVIAQRATARTRPGGHDLLSRAVPAACRLIARLTRGRLTDDHDEVLYVIRKPEDRFARVV
jgi:SAM-dependent methyltransferase